MGCASSAPTEGAAPAAPQTSSAALPDMKREPMLLLDTTGSMSLGTSATDRTPRHETVHQALKILVPRLGEHDSEGEHEEGGGGLRTITFAGGKAEDLEDINADNMAEKWATIEWTGGTYIMPGWNKLLEVYREEFGSRPASERPILMALVLSDGEAGDNDAFTKAMRALPQGIYVVVGVIGFGPEHEKALAAYRSVEAHQSRFRVVTLENHSAKDVAKVMFDIITANQ